MTAADNDHKDPISAELWRAMDRQARPMGPDATIAVVARRLDRRRRRRRAAVWAAMAAGLLATGGMLSQQAIGRNTLVADVAPEPTAETPPDDLGAGLVAPDAELDAADESGRSPGSHSPLAPLQIRAQVALAETGTEVMVWGGHLEPENWGLPGSGQRNFSDGAAFDPATSSWRPLAPAPLPESSSIPHALAVDGGVLVARDRSAAVWNPAADTWRAVEDAPGPVDDLAGGGQLAVSYSARAVLDVATGRWRPLPDPPLALSRPATAWTGSRLVVVGDRGPSQTSPVSNPGSLVLDPTNGAWQETDDPPIGGAEAVAAAFDGARVVAVNYDGTAAALDPVTGRWRELPPVPFRFYENAPTAAATKSGLTIVEIAGTAAVLDGEAWTPLPLDALTGGVGLANTVTAGAVPDGVWVWDVDASGGWVTVAEPLASLSRIGRLQVGVGTVTLPPGFRLASSRSESHGDRVVVEVDGPGGRCHLTSTYSSPFTTVEPIGPGWVSAATADNPAVTWLSSPDGTGWRTLVSSSDTFDIRCPVGTDTAALVSSVDFAYHQSRDG